MTWPSGRSGSLRARPAGELLELQAETYGSGSTVWPPGHPNQPQGVVTVVPGGKPAPPVRFDARGQPV